MSDTTPTQDTPEGAENDAPLTTPHDTEAGSAASESDAAAPDAGAPEAAEHDAAEHDDTVIIDKSGSAPAATEPEPLAPKYGEPLNAAPPFVTPAFSEPAFTKPAFSEPAFSEPAFAEPAFPAAPAAPAATPASTEPTNDEALALVDEPEPAPDAPAPVVPAVPAAEPDYSPAAQAPFAPAAEYIAPASVVAGAAAAAAAPGTAPTAPLGSYVPSPQPIFVQAPTAPANKGNRGAGILIGLLATLAFALLYAASTFLISLSQNASVETAVESFALFVTKPVFYIPVLFFFGAFALLVAIVNRGGWWAYVIGGFAVAVIVYFSFIGGSLLTISAWQMTPTQAGQFVAGQWLNPVAIVAAIAAREVPIWFGAWIAARGRKVTAKNVEARREYDRVLAEGPTLSRV